MVVTNQNYGRMITTWKQRERREGIVLKQISFKVPPPSDEYIVEQFRQAITPRTKVIEVTHITNLTGQIMPVREIVRSRARSALRSSWTARTRSTTSRSSATISSATTTARASTSGCSRRSGPASCTCGGARSRSSGRSWAPCETSKTNIRKYEEIGTHPEANHNAVSTALAFNRGIGADRKIARLRYLRDRWANRLLAESDRVHVLTPLTGTKSGAIGLFYVDGLDPVKLGGWLWDSYRIVSTPIVHAEFKGIRVTPNVYTMPEEIDTFGG